MASLVQFTKPEIKIFSSLNNQIPYFIFSPTSNYDSGTNLLSYSFSKTINSLEGDFQFTYKEDLDTEIRDEDKLYNLVQTLDVVQIYEDDVLKFIGVIIRKSITAMASGLQKTISISGKSIDYLFSYLNISFNVTAMAYTNSELNKTISSMDTQWNLNRGEGPISVKKMVTASFNRFSEVARANSKIANTRVLQMIETWYGTAEEIFNVADGIEFNYPIESNMLADDTCNFITYIQNLLPNNVYEIFGYIKNNKPKIMIREMPFDGQVWKTKTLKTGVKVQGYFGGAWSELNKNPIYADLLTGYTLTRSIEEVYTAFYSYIEGSAFDQSFYENKGAVEQDNKFSGSYAKINDEKVAKYGYVPLRVNFCGFNISQAESETVQNDLSSKLQQLNERIEKWYGSLDEMYDATISVVGCSKVKTSNIGERIDFIDGEFYVTGIEHSWNFNDAVKITFHCERGGKYDLLGNFSELTGITKRLAELKK